MKKKVKNVKMNNFAKICKLSQSEVKKYSCDILKQYGYKPVSKDGFVFAEGEFPILLVAHMDTVHRELPSIIFYDKNDGSLYSPQGIGGDDRCGIYMILEIIKRFNCSVLFCEDEEIGAIGAEKFTRSGYAKKVDYQYIIELDRKGHNDAVFYSCDNPEFEKFITKEFFKTAYGSSSDISVIAPCLKVGAVNLSCGYYNAHTTGEYVIFDEMECVINEVCKLLDRTTDKDKYEYIEEVCKYSYGGYYSYGYGRYGYRDSNLDDYYHLNCMDKDKDGNLKYFRCAYCGAVINDDDELGKMHGLCTDCRDYAVAEYGEEFEKIKEPVYYTVYDMYEDIYGDYCNGLCDRCKDYSCSLNCNPSNANYNYEEDKEQEIERRIYG